MNDVKQYLYLETKRNWYTRYIRYFDEWFNNLTDMQLKYFQAFADGHKTI